MSRSNQSRRQSTVHRSLLGGSGARLASKRLTAVTATIARQPQVTAGGRSKATLRNGRDSRPIVVSSRTRSIPNPITGNRINTLTGKTTSHVPSISELRRGKGRCRPHCPSLTGVCRRQSPGVLPDTLSGSNPRDRRQRKPRLSAGHHRSSARRTPVFFSRNESPSPLDRS